MIRFLGTVAIVLAIVACGSNESVTPDASRAAGHSATSPATATITPAPSSSPQATRRSTSTPPAGAPGGPAEVIRIGNTSRRMVAFSFDAGSDAGFTAQILDTLRTNRIEASFGVTGRWAEA